MLCNTRTQKLPYKSTAIHFFPYKKLLCNAHIQKIYYVFYTQKKYYIITIQKITSIFPIQNYYVVHAHKNYHTKLLAFFPYKNYYVVHAQKFIQFFTSIFSHTKITM